MTPKKIADFLDGQAAPEEKTEIEQALAAGDPRVAEELAWGRDLRAALRDLAAEEATAEPRHDPSAGIEARLGASGVQPDTAGSIIPLAQPQPRRGWSSGHKLLALAAAIAISLGLFFLLSPPRATEKIVVHSTAAQATEHLAWATRVAERLGGRVITPADGKHVRVALPPAQLGLLQRLAPQLPPVFRGSASDPLEELGPFGAASGEMIEVEVVVEPKDE